LREHVRTSENAWVGPELLQALKNLEPAGSGDGRAIRRLRRLMNQLGAINAKVALCLFKAFHSLGQLDAVS